MAVVIFSLRGEALTGRVWLNDDELDIEGVRSITSCDTSRFTWGCSGSNLLSLVVCSKLLGKGDALRNYMKLDSAVISRLDSGCDFDVDIIHDFILRL